MTGLDELLGEEYKTPEARLYLELAREDQSLLGRLVEIRKSRMSQEDLAAALGITQATVSAFERLGNDPKLSTLRRYARAIGVMVRHQVDPDPVGCADSHYISHVSARGVLSTETAAARAYQLNQFAMPWPKDVRSRLEDLPPRRVDELVDAGLAKG